MNDKYEVLHRKLVESFVAANHDEYLQAHGFNAPWSKIPPPPVLNCFVKVLASLVVKLVMDLDKDESDGRRKIEKIEKPEEELR